MNEPELWEMMDYWWRLGAAERAKLCMALSGSMGDCLYPDVPEYVEDWLREHPEVMQ